MSVTILIKLAPGLDLLLSQKPIQNRGKYFSFAHVYYFTNKASSSNHRNKNKGEIFSLYMSSTVGALSSRVGDHLE